MRWAWDFTTNLLHDNSLREITERDVSTFKNALTELLEIGTKAAAVQHHDADLNMVELYVGQVDVISQVLLDA